MATKPNIHNSVEICRDYSFIPLKAQSMWTPSSWFIANFCILMNNRYYAGSGIMLTYHTNETAFSIEGVCPGVYISLFLYWLSMCWEMEVQVAFL